MDSSTMCDIIAEYENDNAVNPDERLTEFVSGFGRFMFKVGMMQDVINDKYKRILEKKKDNTMLIYICKNIGLNRNDIARYSLSNWSEAATDYINIDSENKEAGVIYNDIKIILIKSDGDGSIQAIPLDYENYNSQEIKKIETIRIKIINDINIKLRELLNAKMMELASKTPLLRSKQRGINYKKDILAKMITRTKCFYEENFDGYDFRELDLSGALFINCSLNRANFSGVNLINSLFFNCELQNIIFFKTNLNNAKAYNGGEEIDLKNNMRKALECTNV